MTTDSAPAAGGPDEHDVVPVPQRRQGAPTIYDVAALAGVSASTVSRALNRPGRISAPTEARIRAAADELNFRINPMARALHTGRTSTLALVVADITNPVSFGVVRGVEQAASAAGHTLVIAESLGSADAEAEIVERLLPSVDGIILVTSRLGPEVILPAAQRKPLVLLHQGVTGVDSVSTDVASGVTALFEHLVELGHESIAYLSGPPVPWLSEVRWGPLLEAAERRGLGLVEIGPNEPTIDGGRSAFRRVLASRATAVLAYNDLMAIGLMQAAAENGLAVPSQLSVAGFDDVFGSELIVPSLTTVRVPLVEAGALAAGMLLARLGGDPVEEPAPLGVELVVRDSTAPPRGETV